MGKSSALFAKTDKLYTKRYDDETNLRCHLIIDNSSSMHYPETAGTSIDNLNKVAFSALASASLMHILKKQRDAVGLSIYSDNYDFYSPEKGSERHHQMLLMFQVHYSEFEGLNKNLLRVGQDFPNHFGKQLEAYHPFVVSFHLVQMQHSKMRGQ